MDILQQLTEQSWAVSDDFIDSGLSLQLMQLCEKAPLRAAKIGRAETSRLSQEIRSDEIFWLDPQNCQLAESLFFQKIAEFKQRLNRELFLGINNFEFHYARYPAGGFYKKHLDQHPGQKTRIVSALLYLNPNWHSTHGGRLILYKENAPEQIEKIIEPLAGRFVCFLSDRLYHEVETSQTPRMSLTGWLRHNLPQ